MKEEDATMTDQDRIFYIYEEMGRLKGIPDQIEQLRQANADEHADIRDEIKTLCGTLAGQQTEVATHLAIHDAKDQAACNEKNTQDVVLKRWQVVAGIIGIITSIVLSVLSHLTK